MQLRLTRRVLRYDSRDEFHDHSAAFFGLASVEVAKDHESTAIAFFKLSLNSAPSNEMKAQDHVALGAIAEVNDDLDTAQAEYRAAHDCDGKNIAALEGLHRLRSYGFK